MFSAFLRLANLLAVASLTLLLPACAHRPLQQEFATPSFSDRLHTDIDRGKEDFEAFYTPRTLGALALGIAAAAPLANTSADNDIRDWYQERIHTKSAQPFADVCNYGGQAWVILPVTLELMALNGRFGEEWRDDGGILEWSHRCCRTIALGYPPVIGLYGLLGAGRPDTGDSHWQPFNHFHGVSGHTFIGAVPWLTAATMTDNWLVKAPLVAGSFLTGWSRIHDDEHYAAQVALGWWIAYLCVQTVDQTQKERNWDVIPTAGPDGTGVAFEVRF